VSAKESKKIWAPTPEAPTGPATCPFKPEQHLCLGALQGDNFVIDNADGFSARTAWQNLLFYYFESVLF
jgi:hypothetical protein